MPNISAMILVSIKIKASRVPKDQAINTNPTIRSFVYFLSLAALERITESITIPANVIRIQAPAKVPHYVLLTISKIENSLPSINPTANVIAISTGTARITNTTTVATSFT